MLIWRSVSKLGRGRVVTSENAWIQRDVPRVDPSGWASVHGSTYPSRTKVLCHGDGDIQIKDNVPPAAGHKHRLTRSLYSSQWPVLRLLSFLEHRQHVGKPRDSLPTAAVLRLDHVLRYGLQRTSIVRQLGARVRRGLGCSSFTCASLLALRWLSRTALLLQQTSNQTSNHRCPSPPPPLPSNKMVINFFCAASRFGPHTYW